MNLLSKNLSSSTLYNLMHFSLYLTVFIIFWQKTKNPKVSSTPGRKYILTGCLLLTIGSIFEVLELIATSTNHSGYVGLLEFSQETFGYIAGFIFVLIGICKWLPSIIHEQEMKARLEETNKDLERIMQRYKLVMSTGITWCWEIDLNTLKYHMDSPSALGYSSTELSTFDDYLQKLVHPAYREQVYSTIKKVIEGKIWEYKGERLYKSKDGRKIWVSVKAKAFPDKKGRPKRLIGINYDITDLVETRNKLTETNEKLKRLWDRYEIAMSAASAWCWELDLTTLKFDTIFTTLRLSKENFATLDDLLYFLFYPEKKDIHNLIKEVAEGKRWKFEGVRLFRLEDGKNLWVKVNAKAIPDDKGRPERVIGISYDITDLAEMHKKLEEESALNKTLTELAEHIISTNSISQISELCLEAALHFTQSPHGFAGYVDPETKDLISPCFSKNVWKDCEIQGKKFIFSAESNLIAWVRQKGQPILVNTPEQDFRSSGTPTGHVKIGRFLSVPAIKNYTVIGQIAVANAPFDYTDKHLKIMEQIAKLYALGIERILKENNLQKALFIAQEAAQAKHDFVISISHELRTPLNVILGFGQLLESQRGHLSQDEMAKYISHILEAGRNLTSMIEDILAVASADNMRSSYNMELCSVEHLMNEFKQMAVSMVSKKQVNLEIKIDPNINDLLIRTNPFMLKIALRHLLDNAIKFTPAGGRIFLSFYTNDTDFKISVKDTGIGIDRKNQEKIFEDFVQLKKGMKDKTPGLGLGLGLVKRIANIHGGNIEVQSEGEGKGSEFILKLPLAQKISSEKNKIALSIKHMERFK